MYKAFLICPVILCSMGGKDIAEIGTKKCHVRNTLKIYIIFCHKGYKYALLSENHLWAWLYFYAQQQSLIHFLYTCFFHQIVLRTWHQCYGRDRPFYGKNMYTKNELKFVIVHKNKVMPIDDFQVVKHTCTPCDKKLYRFLMCYGRDTFLYQFQQCLYPPWNII